MGEDLLQAASPASHSYSYSQRRVQPQKGRLRASRHLRHLLTPTETPYGYDVRKERETARGIPVPVRGSARKVGSVAFLARARSADGLPTRPQARSQHGADARSERLAPQVIESFPPRHSASRVTNPCQKYSSGGRGTSRSIKTGGFASVDGRPAARRALPRHFPRRPVAANSMRAIWSGRPVSVFLVRVARRGDE